MQVVGDEADVSDTHAQNHFCAPMQKQVSYMRGDAPTSLAAGV